MALTDKAVTNAKAKAKPYKLGDSEGLFLLVQPSGGKLWRLKYRFGGKEKKLGLGTYPAVSLAKARQLKARARELLAEGKDPSVEKQRAKLRSKEAAESSFEAIAREYCDKRCRDGAKRWSPATATRSEHILSHLYAGIGKLPISEIEPRDVLETVRRLERRGKHESARRALQLAGMVFRYAVATTRLRSDPTRDLRGALVTPTVTHYGAVTDAVAAGQLLRAIDGYEGQGLTKLALQLAPHVFVRPGELRHAEWGEIDFEEAVWSIPAHKMKMRRPHYVPLSRQALALLQEARAVTGPTGYVFPSIRTRARPMSENTINAALRRLGYTTDQMTGHGFRAMASTLLHMVQTKDKRPMWSSDAIERALAHGESDKVKAAYHRGDHWEERIRMAQWWSDHLDQLRKGADIVPIKARAGV